MKPNLLATSRSALAAALCTLLVVPPSLAAPAPRPIPTQIQGQPRVLHALNRLTFGPRPGDVATVMQMGLDKWFELQLNPGKIDDSRLDARLTQFPAMQMSVADLNQRYPGPQALKQMENGNLTLPADPNARIIAQDQIAFYNIQKAKKAEKAPEAGRATLADPAMSTGNSVKPGKRAAQLSPASQSRNTTVDPDGPDRMKPGSDPGMEAAKPLAAADVNPDAITAPETAHLLTPDQVQAILDQPAMQRYGSILAMSPPDLIRLRQSIRPAQAGQLVEGFTPIQKETLAAFPGAIRMVASESMQSRLLRDIYSDRQLEAVMTDFWLNHFNVYVRKNQIEPYLIPTYERETIRPNALGNFEDLLVATAKSPAMLVYLDNFRSTGPDSPQASRIQQAKERNPNLPVLKQASAGLNENYGRELMELHTLGVGGGYSQADVTEVAEVFTGWTLARGGPGGPYQSGTFTFDQRKHEPGPKTVLGHTITGSGMDEGLQVLHMLATSPATAHFVCQKLAIRFVSDTPPPALVDRMAKAFLASHGDIKTVLRTMFTSPEFWSPETINAKVKTPLEFVVSAARASDLEISNAQPLVQSLDKLGMPLYGMQTPNGYSWLKDEWVSTGALVTRLNFSLVMTGGRLPGTRTDWTQLLAGKAPGVRIAAYEATAADAEKERKLETLLLNGPVSERTRQTVLAQAQDTTVAEQAATQFDLNPQGGGGKKASAGPRGFARQLNAAGAGPDDPQAAVMAGLLLGSPEFQRR